MKSLKRKLRKIIKELRAPVTIPFWALLFYSMLASLGLVTLMQVVGL